MQSRARKQDWSAGATVKVGFLSLTVIAKIPTPGDYMPDAYVLANAAKGTFYEFVPHNGLTKIDAEDAQELIAAGNRAAERKALADDRALNALKPTPAYYAPSDLYSLSQQNRGLL